MSSCAVAGAATTINLAPATAAPGSAATFAMRTRRVPAASMSVIAPLSCKERKAVASRRQKRTSCPCSLRSAAAA